MEPSQPGCHLGKTRAEPLQTIPFGSAFALAQAVARARSPAAPVSVIAHLAPHPGSTMLVTGAELPPLLAT